MTALPQPSAMREYESVDRRLFEEQVRPAGQPAVLRGIARDWPAVQAASRWDEDAVAYLKRFSHAEPVSAIVGAPEIGGRFFYTDDLSALNFTRGLSPLDPFLDRLLRDRGAERPYAIAVQSAPISELLPGFVDENPQPLLPPSVVPRIWLGNAIRVAPHADLMENIGIVVAGRRRFTVFPPDQIGNLYIGPMELTPAGTPISLVDLAAPDLARFPRFAAALAVAQTAELEPGDAIYIPYHWWHAVDSLAPVNAFVNYWWNDAPAGVGEPYDALLYALYAIAGRPADQRAVWRTIFEHLVFKPDDEAPAAHIPEHARGVLGTLREPQFARMRTTLIETLSRRD